MGKKTLKHERTYTRKQYLLNTKLLTKQNNEWVEYGVSPAGTSLGTKWVEQDVYINGSGLQLEKLR